MVTKIDMLNKITKTAFYKVFDNSFETGYVGKAILSKKHKNYGELDEITLTIKEAYDEIIAMEKNKNEIIQANKEKEEKEKLYEKWLVSINGKKICDEEYWIHDDSIYDKYFNYIVRLPKKPVNDIEKWLCDYLSGIDSEQYD